MYNIIVIDACNAHSSIVCPVKVFRQPQAFKYIKRALRPRGMKTKIYICIDNCIFALYNVCQFIGVFLLTVVVKRLEEQAAVNAHFLQLVRAHFSTCELFSLIEDRNAVIACLNEAASDSAKLIAATAANSTAATGSKLRQEWQSALRKRLEAFGYAHLLADD